MLWLFLLDFKAYNRGFKGHQKPKTHCDNSSFAILSFTLVLIVRSGPVCQRNSRRLWQSQRRKSRSVPEGGADFPAAIFQTLTGIAFRAAAKSGNNFPAASKFAGKLFQQGISDSHSLLEFPVSRRLPRQHMPTTVLVAPRGIPKPMASFLAILNPCDLNKFNKIERGEKTPTLKISAL